MPELPDLQVISSNLTKRYANKSLKKVNIFKDKKLNAPKEKLSLTFEGAKLINVLREGKELHMKFDNQHTLGLHLMLKGEIYAFGDEQLNAGELFPSPTKEIKHKIIEFEFEDSTGFALTDFMAQAKAIYDPSVPDVPDALSDAFTIQYLSEKLEANSGVKLKAFLVNQEMVRGIGNAYADEIMWHCQISPYSLCDKIPDNKVYDLFSSVKVVLIEAEAQIRQIQPDIISGEIRSFLAVHTTTRQKSPKDEEIIIEELNNKKTYFTRNQLIYE